MSLASSLGRRAEGYRKPWMTCVPVEEVVVATAVTGRPLVLSPLLSSALSAANMDIVSGTRRWSSCR